MVYRDSRQAPRKIHVARKIAKFLPASQPKAAAPQPGLWEGRLRPLLDGRAPMLALALILIGSLRIASTYTRFSFTADEPGHFACGLEYLQRHVYRFEAQHPPLARAAMALLPYLDGSRLTGLSPQDREGMAVMYQRGNPQRTLVLMRLGILPFFVLAGLVVFWWARHSFGPAVAVIATALFTMLPSVLAHAGLATTDMPFTACLAAAYLCMLLWAERPTTRRSLLFGAACGLMVLTKFTAIVYFPAGVALALLAWMLGTGPGWWREVVALGKARAPGFGIAVITGALVVWAGYLFSFGRISGAGIYVPAPELFDGILWVQRHNREGHMAYLFGQVSRTGWWYYFPVVLALKTPIAFLLLLAPGAWLCWKGGTRARLPLAFALGVLLPAMAGHINIGVRHVLPVYVAFSIMAAVAVVKLTETAAGGKWAGAAVAAALIWLLATGVWRHPYYLAYFNETVGSEPEKVLVDSDLDWAQDYLEVATRLRQLGVTTASFGTTPWIDAYFRIWPGIPPGPGVRAMFPAEGWTIISPTADKLNQYGLNYRYPNLKPWFDTIPPTERVGAILLYYVPHGAIRRKVQSDPTTPGGR